MAKKLNLILWVCTLIRPYKGVPPIPSILVVVMKCYVVRMYVIGHLEREPILKEAVHFKFTRVKANKHSFRKPNNYMYSRRLILEKLAKMSDLYLVGFEPPKIDPNNRGKERHQ